MLDETLHIKQGFHIVVVGAGTAGCLAAAMLAKQNATNWNNCAKITLIYSPDTPTIGVGEGTIPSIKGIINYLELDEFEFMRRCGATFKAGIKFYNWNNDDQGDLNYHPFGPTLNQERDSMMTWQCDTIQQHFESYSHLLSSSVYHAPMNKFFYKAPSDVGNEIPNSAYHLDAQKFGDYMMAYSKNNGVNIICDHIDDVVVDSEKGFVNRLKLRKNNDISANLFVDCSGFARLLVGKYDVGWVSYKDKLICDRAVAIQRPWRKNETWQPWTQSTASAAGWQWAIPLHHRVGTGYVYSSAHISSDEAEASLRKNQKIRKNTKSLHIKFDSGRLKEPWVNNVVAVGLSQGFVEPLEATSIHTTSMSIYHLYRLLEKPRQNDQAMRDEYNKEMAFSLDNIADFLQFHYLCAQRQDNDFWHDCKTFAQQSDNLQKIFAFLYYKDHRTPKIELDFFSLVSFMIFFTSNQQMFATLDGVDNPFKNNNMDELITHIKKYNQDMSCFASDYHEFLNKIYS